MFTIFKVINENNMALKRNSILNPSTTLLEIFNNVAEQRFRKRSSYNVYVLFRFSEKFETSVNYDNERLLRVQLQYDMPISILWYILSECMCLS